MNLTASIGQPIQPPRTRNLYCIKVQTDLGDGDALGGNQMHFVDLTEALKYFSLLLAWCGLADKDFVYQAYRECEPNCLVETTIRQRATDLGMDADVAFAWVDALVGEDDYLEDGWRALLDRAWLTYYDDKGIEYEVLVTVRGEGEASYTASTFEAPSRELRKLLGGKV